MTSLIPNTVATTCPSKIGCRRYIRKILLKCNKVETQIRRRPYH